MLVSPSMGAPLTSHQHVARSLQALHKNLAQDCKPGKKKKKKISIKPVLGKKARGHLPPSKAKEILTLRWSGIHQSWEAKGEEKPS